MAYPQPYENKPKSKCRKWRLWANVGMNPRTGEYSKRSKLFEGTYTEAKRAADNFEAELKESGISGDSKPIPFDLLVNEWISYRKSLRLVSDSTIAKNKNMLNIFVFHLAKVRSDKLTVRHIQQAISSLLNGDSPSGKKLSATYVICAIQTASSMYDYAIKFGMASYNPFKEVDKPKIDTKKRKSLSSSQIDQIKKLCTPNDERHVMVMLALMQGLRRTEARLAQVGDIDFKHNEFLVRGTKTESAYDLLPLNPYLSDFLKQWIGFQARRMRSHGLKLNKSTPLVSNEFGIGYKDSHSVTRWWERNRDKLGCSGYTFHELRHTYATILARNRVQPAVIQQLMRHSDPRTSQAIYEHVNKEDCRAELNRINW